MNLRTLAVAYGILIVTLALIVVVAIKIEPESIKVYVPINKGTQPEWTSSWKTYRNDEYGVEFKYPSMFEVTEHNDYAWEDRYYKGVSLAAEDLVINMEFEDTTGTGGAPTRDVTQETVTIRQMDFTKYTYFGYQVLPEGTWILMYKFDNKGREHKFSTGDEGVDSVYSIPLSTEILMEQILSTLRFVN